MKVDRKFAKSIWFVTVFLAIRGLTACDSERQTRIAGQLSAPGEPACETCPRTPTEVQISVDEKSRMTIEFKDNSPNEDGFMIERKTGDSTFIPIATFTTKEPCKLENPTREAPCFFDNDPGLLPGATYTYRVHAFRKTEHSNYSTPVTVTYSVGVVACAEEPPCPLEKKRSGEEEETGASASAPASTSGSGTTGTSSGSGASAGASSSSGTTGSSSSGTTSK